RAARKGPHPSLRIQSDVADEHARHLRARDECGLELEQPVIPSAVEREESGRGAYEQRHADRPDSSPSSRLRNDKMWNPDQYLRFRDERKQPFLDLLALIERRPHMRVVDLGCGTGELTHELHQTLSAEETIGVDNSESMLKKSKPGNGVRFDLSDIESYAPKEKVDLIFSNAALHWVRDHHALLKRLASFLKPDGQLAIQMPANDDHPSHA